MTTVGVPHDRRLAEVLVAELGDAIDIVVDAEILEGYRRDQAAPGILAAGHPTALVRPRTTSEVQSAVRAAARHGIPVVPRGAGSGLSGGANAIEGSLILSTERMTSIVEVDPGGMTASVEAGVVNDALRLAAAEVDLWYAPDPASRHQCTIGGNVATNAGGLCCIKYGVTRDALLGLEVVLADGQAVSLGGRTRKNVVGYDLGSLFCGSEGTLGIVTRATVRLLPRPSRAVTLAASFDDLRGAGKAVARIVRETTPAMLELVDRTTIEAIQAWKPMGLDEGAAALLFARSDAGAAAGDEIAAIERACREAGAGLVVTTDDEAEARMILAARTLAYPALERLGSCMLDDVAVPPSALVELLDGIARVADRLDLTIGTFGHAGEGNLHPTIVFDHRDDIAVQRTRDAFSSIIALAHSLGGTATGEHGVGSLKRATMAEEVGAALPLHRAIKSALDPRGLFNPGKAIA
jgi:glycolate oxidase